MSFPMSLRCSGGAKTSGQPGHFQVTKVVRKVIRCKRQRSKGAKSFRGQKILKPDHRMHFFPEKVDAADCFTVEIEQIKRSNMVTS